MAMHQFAGIWSIMNTLTKEQVFDLIDSINTSQLNFERIRPCDIGEIHRPDTMTKVSFKRMVSVAMDEGHQPVGDIELVIPAIYKVLVGRHDGTYWLE